jgi:hypothetical protein
LNTSSPGRLEGEASAATTATDLTATPASGVSPLDAFARLSTSVIQLEAIAGAAKAAIDAYGLPSDPDRDFLRMHALVGAVAKTAVRLVDLAKEVADIHPLDAFERLSIGVVQLEAIANAANSAIDECGVPSSGSRRDFDRVQALVSETAETSTALVELGEQLKASLRRHRMDRLASAGEAG